MDVIFFTYPWAMDIPGGGERQMLAYREHLGRFGIKARLFDMWNPCFKDSSIFHCFSVMPSTLELCEYSKKSGLKLVISPNLWITPETKHQYPFDYIWAIFELADLIIVNSNMELLTLSTTFGFPESKFYVVYNAAEVEFILPEHPDIFKELYSIYNPFVLNIANIEKRKNQLLFIQALTRARPDLDLVIIGGIRDKNYANECIEAGGKKLIIVDQIPYSSPVLRSALSGCEFFAMPSLLETPSIAAIEAAAIGARVLLTDQGSTKEYFGDSVIYVDPTSIKSLESGILGINNCNPEKSIWVARSKHLWPKVIPSLVTAYNALLSR